MYTTYRDQRCSSDGNKITDFTLGIAASLAVRFLLVALQVKKIRANVDYQDYNPIRTFTFFVLHVRHPVLLRVNLPRLRCTGSASNDEGAAGAGCGSTFTVRWRLYMSSANWLNEGHGQCQIRVSEKSEVTHN
jgi:hypothetical protein